MPSNNNACSDLHQTFHGTLAQESTNLPSSSPDKYEPQFDFSQPFQQLFDTFISPINFNAQKVSAVFSDKSKFFYSESKSVNMKSGSDEDALKALDAVFSEDSNRSFMKNVRGVFRSYFGNNRNAEIQGRQREPIREGKQGD
jgi:hypothetical protein